MQIEGCNCREYPDLKGGNLLCPLPCSTAGRVAYGHPTCTVKIPLITVIIRHNCRNFRVHVFIAIIDSTGWIVNICQEHTSRLFSTPQLSSHPWTLLKYYPVSVSLSWVLGRWACPCYGASLSHNFFFWAKSSNTSWEEKKLSIHSL